LLKRYSVAQRRHRHGLTPEGGESMTIKATSEIVPAIKIGKTG